MSLLVQGNTKLGPRIHHFSLPAGKTCPGKTDACASCCYAQDGFYHMPSTKAHNESNLRASKRATFVQNMAEAIEKARVKILRIHVAGDFYSAEYAEKWLQLVKMFPGVKFYTYTRSWRIKTIAPVLKELSQQPNFELWLSCDKDTHAKAKPPKWKGVRVCYMQMDEHDSVPEYVDLVFRVTVNGIAKFIDGHFVCPAENGMTYSPAFGKMTCSKCLACTKARPIPTQLQQELSVIT